MTRTEAKLTCARCGLELDPRDTGIRHGYSGLSHSEDRCIALLQAAIAELVEHIGKGSRLLRLMQEHDRANSPIVIALLDQLCSHEESVIESHTFDGEAVRVGRTQQDAMDYVVVRRARRVWRRAQEMMLRLEGKL